MKPAYDIAVVGSGSAGVAAAVSAARQGAKVILLDRRSAAGGIGGWSGLSTLCGLYDDAGNWLVTGFAREFAQAVSPLAPVRSGRLWYLPYRPEDFRQTAARFLSATPGLTGQWQTELSSVTLQNSRITAINNIPVAAVVDCSGDAVAARLAGLETWQTDASTQAPAVVFTLRGLARTMASPADAAGILLPVIRAGFPALHFHPHPEPQTITVKFSGPPEQVPALLDFLRSSVPGCQACRTDQPHFSASNRAGRMIPGRHQLTGQDVLTARKFPNAVARSAWPVEQWQPDGRTRLQALPPGEYYEIPPGCLQSQAVPNLFMAGKCLSADANAMASARVMGTCLATGAAAGQLAADFVKSNA